MAHANGPTARATVFSLCLCSRVPHTTNCLYKRHLFPTTSARKISYVYHVPEVLLLLLPLFFSLYLSLSLFKGTSHNNIAISLSTLHFSIYPFIFSQLQRSVCTNGIYSLPPFWPVFFSICDLILCTPLYATN